MTLTSSPQRVSRWLDACRTQRRSSLIKRAVGGGEVPFEQAFSNLAHAFIHEKAPGLLPYELGFQLLEKNEDNDKAVGIFGFQVGEQLMYAPVFYINEELKGHELLYLKDSDTFVPLQENWINYVLNRKPVSIGEGTTRSTQMLGVERPSMDVFRTSPGKYASSQPPWLQSGLPAIAYAADPQALRQQLNHELMLPRLVKQSGAAAMGLLRFVDAAPQLLRPLVDCYGPELLKEAMESAQSLQSASPRRLERAPQRVLTGSIYQEKTALEAAREADPRRTGKLRVHVYDDEKPAPTSLSEKQAQNLKRDGVLIEDDRETTSRLYRSQPPLTLQNPDQTGIYDVLMYPDKFEQCLVLVGPQGERGKRPDSLLVRIGDSGNKAWYQGHPADIFAEPLLGDEFNSYLNDLPEATSLDVGATYVLLTPHGDGTSAFRVRGTCPAEGEESCYTVDWLGSYGDHRPDRLPPIYQHRYEYDNDYDGVEMLSLGRIKGTKIINRLTTMYLPAGTKAVKLEAADPQPEVFDPSPGNSSDPPPIRPGSHVSLQLGIYKTSEELKLFSDGMEATINGQRMPVKAALLSLVCRHGLREKTAREALGEAERKHGQRYRIKYAQPYDMIASAPVAPPIPDQQMTADSYFGSGLPTTEYQEETIPVNMPTTVGRNDDIYNAARPPDPQMIRMVEQAAQTGQRELLDTSMLSSLLKTTRDDAIVDRHLGDLVKALDRIGRLLFNFYWHNERFADRFGDNELPDLEDALRNSFEDLGDLVLFLKQKTIEPYSDTSTDVDLATMGANA